MAKRTSAASRVFAILAFDASRYELGLLARKLIFDSEYRRSDSPKKLGNPERRITAVREVLDELGIADTPELLVFNQIDRLPKGVAREFTLLGGGVAVSALKQIGLDDLLEQAGELLWAESRFGGDRASQWQRAVLSMEGI